MFFKNRPRYYFHYESVKRGGGSFLEYRVYTKGKKKNYVNHPVKRRITDEIAKLAHIRFLTGYDELTNAALVTASTKQFRALVELIVGELYV